MTTLIVSTVRRHTPSDEPSGYIHAVDLEKSQVVQRSNIIEPAYREVDDNPRGGMRGSKGITLREGQIALSNFSMVFRYDPQWNLLGVISHPSCAGIHDILFDENSLWVTSARTDTLMHFDLDGNLMDQVYIRGDRSILKSLDWRVPVLLNDDDIRSGRIDFRDPRSHEKESYDRAHLNSICVLPDGDVLVSLGFVFGMEFANLLRLKIFLVKMGIWSPLMAINNQLRNWVGKKDKNTDKTLIVHPAQAKSAIVRISSNGNHEICFSLPGMTAPSHSLLSMSDGTAVYLNTTDGSLVHFNTGSGDILSSTKITDGFLRGVTKLSEETLIVGSKGELMVFDLPNRRVEKRIRISDDSHEAVYDVKVLPPEYLLPPLDFQQHFAEETGFKDAAGWIKANKFPNRN